MSHEEASEMLGAYALEPADGHTDEFADLEEHLETCPRCRSELAMLREAASALDNSVEPPPEGLWSDAASGRPEDRRDEQSPPAPHLEPTTRSPFRARSSGRVRRSRNMVVLLGAVAVAAVAVAVVLGIGLVRAQNNVSSLRSNVSRLQADVSRLHAQGKTSPVAVALRTPGSIVVILESSSGSPLAKFVITPGGQGYLVSSDLPGLSSGRTYQLWGIVGTTPISLGVLGPAPHSAAFTIAGSPWTSKLALTAEPTGGAVAPTGTIVASGTV